MIRLTAPTARAIIQIKMIKTVIIRPSVDARSWTLEQFEKDLNEGWKIIRTDIVEDRIIYVLEKITIK